MRSLTETPVTLNGLVTASAAWDDAFLEIPLNGQELEFNADGILHGGQLIPMDQPARTALFEKIGAPGRYLEKHNPGFQATALAEHAGRGDFGHKPTLVLRDGELVTIVRGELLSLPNAAVLR